MTGTPKRLPFEQLLEGFATPVWLKANEALFFEGDDGDAMFVVRSGALEVSVSSEDGRKLVLDIIRPGSVFGEIALFDPGPRTATVRAIEKAELMSLSHGDARIAIEDDPSLALELVRLAGQRMRLMTGQLGDQVFLPLSARLARRVLYLDDGSSAPLQLNQSQLAEFVGATREAVSKTLRDWKAAGLVEAHRGGLTIMDREALSIVALRRQY
ncbi:MAG: Crp/Fnr family transcriptional regulator [Pseudomonadota bacterium]